jgi:hypothetical protein
VRVAEAASMEEPGNWQTDYRVDRSVFTVAGMDEPDDALAYWLSRTVAERLEGLELARRICYGEAACTARFQRVLEVADLG